MQHISGTTRESLVSVARARELGITKANLIKDYLNSAGMTSEFADKIADGLVPLAEERYLAQVRQMAMDLMEHDRSLTAAEATAFVDGMILDAVIS